VPHRKCTSILSWNTASGIPSVISYRNVVNNTVSGIPSVIPYRNVVNIFSISLVSDKFANWNPT
jgi:hypothetical protein